MFASVSFGSAGEWWTLLKGAAPWMCGCFAVGLAVGFALRRYFPLAILAAAACGLAVAVYAEWTSERVPMSGHRVSTRKRVVMQVLGTRVLVSWSSTGEASRSDCTRSLHSRQTGGPYSLSRKRLVGSRSGSKCSSAQPSHAVSSSTPLYHALAPAGAVRCG